MLKVFWYCSSVTLSSGQAISMLALLNAASKHPYVFAVKSTVTFYVNSQATSAWIKDAWPSRCLIWATTTVPHPSLVYNEEQVLTREAFILELALLVFNHIDFTEHVACL